MDAPAGRDCTHHKRKKRSNKVQNSGILDLIYFLHKTTAPARLYHVGYQLKKC